MNLHEHNVLARTDRSTTPIPGTAGVLKRLKYGWRDPSSKGTFLEIPKMDLLLDGRYQRDRVSLGKERRIASNWDWMLFGTIKVAMRSDGSLWVVDGGHRVRASYLRDDVELLPAMVFEFESLKDEANAFLGTNTLINNVSAISKHRAAVCGENEVHVAAHEMLTKRGLEVVATAAKPNQIKCIGAIIRGVEADRNLAESVLDFCLKLSPDSPVTSTMFRGLFTLCQRLGQDVVLDKYGDRLLRCGLEVINRSIRSYKAESGTGGEVADAKGILAAINHGLRNKLRWTTDSH